MFISTITHMPINDTGLVNEHDDNLFVTSEEYRKEVQDLLTPTEQEDVPATAYTFILGYN
ncbi:MULTISPECIES: hypothetical protein [Pseudoalteromonas]|uniref:Uncharacterized protein n=1 Tax=Pseudoalteromonas aurantia 208 TaxID=1314867 RepID=A0ABR9E6T7_9GAMM|nr:MULTISPECIES: hypothetical protein [Pseudoalteromonas]MBE0366703.1 hypothetical protein [Pseudoalteromonas aurantia 208]MBQ4847871.1 hypothetical protein [Pseudoalteromonas sp. MMG005]MBQ4849945.1 hypothetical protein [Pseudoalteromonas sp. MMG012]